MPEPLCVSQCCFDSIDWQVLEAIDTQAVSRVGGEIGALPRLSPLDRILPGPRNGRRHRPTQNLPAAEFQESARGVVLRQVSRPKSDQVK
jgi:hypothetical protein